MTCSHDMLRKVAAIVLTSFLAIVTWLLKPSMPAPLAVAVLGFWMLLLALQLWALRDENYERLKDAVTGLLETNVNAVGLPRLEMGDSGSILTFAGPAAQPIILVFRDCGVTIRIRQNRWTRKRRLVLSTRVFDRKGNLVAEILDNNWKINPNATFDRNFTKEALEVRDSSGDIVLQVRLVGDRVQMQAKFYGLNGHGVAIGKCADAAGNVGGCIQYRGPASPTLTMTFQPIFRYPSAEYQGKYAKHKGDLVADSAPRTCRRQFRSDLPEPGAQGSNPCAPTQSNTKGGSRAAPPRRCTAKVYSQGWRPRPTGIDHSYSLATGNDPDRTSANNSKTEGPRFESLRPCHSPEYEVRPWPEMPGRLYSQAV